MIVVQQINRIVGAWNDLDLSKEKEPIQVIRIQ